MEIGKVVHYYNKLSVAVVELKEPLKLSDHVAFVGRTTDFDQAIDSMQINHENIESAKAGQEVAVKVKDRVRCGDKLCEYEKTKSEDE